MTRAVGQSSDERTDVVGRDQLPDILEHDRCGRRRRLVAPVARLDEGGVQAAVLARTNVLDQCAVACRVPVELAEEDDAIRDLPSLAVLPSLASAAEARSVSSPPHATIPHAQIAITIVNSRMPRSCPASGEPLARVSSGRSSVAKRGTRFNRAGPAGDRALHVRQPGRQHARRHGRASTDSKCARTASRALHPRVGEPWRSPSTARNPQGPKRSLA